MSMNTYLPGRLRNTSLPKSRGLFPLFEAVVNSIHSIAEATSDLTKGEITIEIIRLPQESFSYSETKRTPPQTENIIGFKIIDNGLGFHEKNMDSFETLDSDYKSKKGCKGIGRLLWLKAFEKVQINSDFVDQTGIIKNRSFTFTINHGVSESKIKDAILCTALQTCVHLDGFNPLYRDKSPKTARAIAQNLFEHCLWYFVRDEGAPMITIKDDQERINLYDVYKEHMHSEANKETISFKNQSFELTHIKLKANFAKHPLIAWCAASRVVKEENITSKVPGLHGKIKEDTGDFIYACYVTSTYLDQHVRPERIDFDIAEVNDGIFTETEIGLNEIRSKILASSSKFLANYLQESLRAGRERVENFVAHRAPRYRPILGRLSEDKLNINPDITDKDLDLHLHKQLSEIEGRLLAEGHEILNFGKQESPAEYLSKVAKYRGLVDDIKKSDLANYVFHRKTVLEILEKAIQCNEDGKYAKEDLIHELIMPMRRTSNEIHFESCNLWLIDERLAFHDFLASDRNISVLPITNSTDNKVPDICVLNVFDEPILVSDGPTMPLASIVIIEIKRPMRNDASAGEVNDPIEQAFGYLERIRKGGTKTAAGRPIPRAEDIPGFCYAICDLTPTIIKRCKTLNLTETSDRLGYFGYNQNYKAYIEVISYDRLLNSAKERNRAFFDKLNLP